MKNYDNAGETVTASLAGGAVSGNFYIINDCLAVATEDAEANELITFRIVGRFISAPKVAGVAWGQLERLDWDASANSLTRLGGTTAAGDVEFVALAAEAAASSATEGVVILTPGTGVAA
ncbi:MAG: DUF2190 family protein [Pseudomonadota bacterium]